jgi:hypothetical protein
MAMLYRCDMDTLATNLRKANAHHAGLLRTGDKRAICQAYIAALEAERTLLLDCGGETDLEAAETIGYQIEGERAALARLA